MASADAKPFPLKNVAYRATFPILDADGDLVAGAAGLDSEISKDGGTFADCTSEATQIATDSGMYYLDLTATEMNADTVAIIVKTSTSGAKTTPIVMYPVENTDIPVNVKAISDDTTAPDNLELMYDGTGYAGGATKLEVDIVKLLGTAWLTPGVAGTPDVNTKLLGGTAQTGNDVGADVNDILTDTGTTLDTLIKDIPTVAEFEARSILSADYVVVGDTIAGVTAVTNDVGITQGGADKVRASVCVTGDPANSIGKILYEIYTNRLTSARAGYLGNINNANLATIADISALTATEIAYLNASVSSRSSHNAAAVWSAGSRALSTPNDYKADVSSLALEATLTAMKGATFAEATDSLEAIRDRGDAAWITGAGGSDRLLMVDTTIATLASQTSFTLTAGSADDDAYNNCTIVIEDASTAIQKAVAIISNYVGASKTIALKYDPAIFTMAATDKVYILAENALKATLANRQLNVAADGDIAGNVDGSVGSVTADVGITQAGADKVWGTAARALTDKADFSLAAAGITAIWEKNISAFSGAGYAGTYVKTLYDDWLNGGRLDLILDIIAADVVNIDGDAMRGTDSANTTTPPTVNEIADQVWDELLTGATHNIATSAGRRLREVGAYAIDSGTAQAGTATTITLAATADGGDGIFNRNLIVIVDGTGAGQTRTIADYNNTTKVCTIDREWRIDPNATSVYQVLADDTPLVVDHGVAQGGTATTITLRAYASATNDAYLCNIIAIIGGTGRGQARLVGSYVGATKVVTICGDNWVATPDITSVYAMIPYGTSCASCMGTTALTEINAECDTALTDYDPPTRTEATADKDAIITEVDANETKIDTIDGVVDAILADTGTDGVVVASGSKTGYALSAVGVDAILDEIVEGTTTFRQMMRIFMAALAGKSAGGGTVTLTFRDIADGKARITATVDASGNRTAMVLDGA